MVDAVDAIIVVGPVLWKCVNCDLLFSRQHSTDFHLRSSHASAGGKDLQHRSSLKEKCDVPQCCCRSFCKGSASATPRRTKKSSSKAKSSRRALPGEGEETSGETQKNPDDSLDDDEVLQALRVRVEEVFKKSKDSSSTNNEETGGVSESLNDLSTEPEELTGDDSSLQLNAEHFMTCSDAIPEVDEGKTAEAGNGVEFILAACQEENSQKNIGLSISSETSITELTDNQSMSLDDSISIMSKDTNKTKLCRKRSKQTGNKTRAGTPVKNKRGRKSDEKVGRAEKSSGSPDGKLDHVSVRDPGDSRRSSGRANKGKNNSLYTQYKVEIS